MSFASVLNSYCNALGCTSKQIADRCGLSPSTLSRYRNGERAPKPGSDVLERLASGIAELSRERGLMESWNAVKVRNELEAGLTGLVVTGMSFGARVNAVMKLLDMHNSEVAEVLGLSPSYVSRIRNEQRAPSENRSRAVKFSHMAAHRCIDLDKKSQVIDMIAYDKSTSEDLLANSDDPDYLADAISRWLLGSHIVESDIAALENLFALVDDFYFDEVLRRIDELELKDATPAVPETIVCFDTGSKELHRAEIQFFESSAALGAKTVYLSSDMPMLETALLPGFTEAYLRLVGTLVRKGARFTVFHVVDRPLIESVVLFEMWLPLFIAGYAKPSYLPSGSDLMVMQENYVSDTCALACESVLGHQADGRCMLTTRESDVTYYMRKMEFVSEHATSLLEVYRGDDPSQLKRFTKLYSANMREARDREVCAGKYENIRIVSHPGNCVIVTIAHDPVIYLVIRHPKLCYAIAHMR